MLAWKNERENVILPSLMNEYNCPIWLMSQREYAEETVFFSLKLPTQFAARRRTIIVFSYTASTNAIERRDFVGMMQGELDQMATYIAGKNPARICMNVDTTHAFSDGQHVGENSLVLEALGPELTSRIVYEPLLALNFIAARVVRETSQLSLYKDVMATVWSIITDMFSSRVVVPGVTTTDDLRWYYRDRVQALGYSTWFHPSVSLDRRNSTVTSGIIQYGDFLWCDVGFTIAGMNTDTQHNGYVRYPDETDAPAGMQAALKTSNQLQDILLGEMKIGLTGNQILDNALAKMRAQNINGTIYTHPIGDQGHGAGTTIGLWDVQDSSSESLVRGNVAIRTNQWFSIELQATSPISEWNGQLVSVRQEEDIYIDDQGELHWVFGRQEQLHLI